GFAVGEEAVDAVDRLRFRGRGWSARVLGVRSHWRSLSFPTWGCCTLRTNRFSPPAPLIIRNCPPFYRTRRKAGSLTKRKVRRKMSGDSESQTYIAIITRARVIRRQQQRSAYSIP